MKKGTSTPLNQVIGPLGAFGGQQAQFFGDN